MNIHQISLIFHDDVSYGRWLLWVKHEWHPMKIDEMRGDWWFDISQFDESLVMMKSHIIWVITLNSSTICAVCAGEASRGNLRERDDPMNIDRNKRRIGVGLVIFPWILMRWEERLVSDWENTSNRRWRSRWGRWGLYHCNTAGHHRASSGCGSCNWQEEKWILIESLATSSAPLIHEKRFNGGAVGRVIR